MSAPDLGRLLIRAAALLHFNEGQPQPARFAMRLDDCDFQCVARLVWRLHDSGLRVVVADAVTGGALCESLPGRLYDLDRHDDDDGQPTTPAGQADSETKFPSFMAELVDRAASRLKAEGWHQSIAFTWWADGESSPYTARIDWSPNEMAPRVIVFNGGSGDFVCQSLLGKLYEIDPHTWCRDVAPDVVAEYDHRQCQQRQQRADYCPGAGGTGDAA